MAFSTLAIDLTAKVAGFEEGMNKAVKSLDRVDKRAAAMSKSIRTAFGALGATLSVGAVTAYGKSIIDAADGLKDMSDRTGVAIKDLAGLSRGAEQSGTSLEAVAKGIQRLTLSVGQAQGGNTELAKSLNDLGVNAKDPTERLYQLADAVNNSKDPTRTAADLAKVLGKSYAELLPYLKQGADELRKSARESATFSNAMAELAPNADRFNDQLTDLKFNAAGAAASILNSLVPAVNAFMERMSNIRAAQGAGGFFNSLNLTGTLSKDLPKVTAEIRILEKELSLMSDKDFDPFGDKAATEKKLADLKAIKSALREISLAGAMSLADQQYKKTPSGAVGEFDPFKETKTTKAAKTKLDEIDPFAKERAAAQKAYMDDQQRIADYFIDLEEKKTEAIYEQSKAWTDAGRALEEDMRTPLENFEDRLNKINELFRMGAISVETLDRATADAFDNVGTTIKKASDEMDTFAKEAAEGIQNAFADFLFDPFADGLDGMLQGFGQMIQKMIAEAVAADLARRLFGDLVKGGSGSGLAGGFLSSIGGMLGLANGGIVGSGGMMPLAKYASGGIASTPQLAVFGEGSMNEAFVPLPDGRSIPVSMRGGGNTIIVNVTGNNAPDVRRAAGQGAREALGIMNGATRYA